MARLRYALVEQAYDARMVREYQDGWVDYTPRGGKHIDLAWQWYKTTDGILYHPGDHPAFAGHLRWGRLKDGRPWVQATFLRNNSAEWVFEGPEADKLVELAVVELQALRPDDRWETRPVQ